jgi:hypothetical protein
VEPLKALHVGKYETEFREKLSLDDLSAAYGSPPISFQAERDSFNHQSLHFNYSSIPVNAAQLDHRMEGLLTDYKFEIAPDFLTPAHILRTVQRVARTHGDKSSGSVFARRGWPTNKDVFSNIYDHGVSLAVHQRVKALMSSSPEEARYLADPVRIFQKREPHKASKLAEKRYRLLCGVSLIDRIVDELLYHEMLETAKDHCQDGPLKPGFNFKGGGVDKMVTKYAADRSREWQSFDSKQHDITAPAWALETVLRVNGNLCVTTGPSKDQWLLLAHRREQSTLYGELVFSDGTVLRKIIPGLQPSGRLTTIDSNSKLVLTYRVCYDIKREVPSCKDDNVMMGDDTVLKNIGDPAKFLHFLSGFGVTWTIESEPGLFADQNFCSMKFHLHESGMYVPIPLNWDKNVYNLSNPEKGSPDDGGALLSLCIEYAYDAEHFSKLHNLLATHYKNVYKSPSWCQWVVSAAEGAIEIPA